MLTVSFSDSSQPDRWSVWILRRIPREGNSLKRLFTYMAVLLTEPRSLQGHIWQRTCQTVSVSSYSVGTREKWGLRKPEGLPTIPTQKL